MWTIRHDQMTAFADDAFAQVHARVSRHVAATHPEVPIALGDAAYDGWVRELLEAGIALNAAAHKRTSCGSWSGTRRRASTRR